MRGVFYYMYMYMYMLILLPKLLLTRKFIAYFVFFIGGMSIVYVLYNDKNTSLEMESQPSDASLVNKTWTAIRNSLLEEQRVSKVIILAHARGGSTLCSDVFNIDTNNTVLWYEALHGFHSFYSGVPHYGPDTMFLYNKDLTRRPADKTKQRELAKYLTQLLTCDFENVPIELISMSTYMKKSAVFNDLVVCIERLNIFNRFKHCQDIISKYCVQEDMLGNLEHNVSDPIVSSFKCADLLQSIRRLKSQPGKRVTINEILRSYFNDQSINKTIQEQTVYTACPQFADLSQKEEFRFKTNSKSSQRCLMLAFKLNPFIRHDQCLEELDGVALACRQKMSAPCRRTRLTVAEFQRVFIEDLEPFIQQMPDIHVVHYVRDPRAVSVSRAEKHMHTFRHTMSWTAMHETYLLCHRMRYDIEQKKRLQERYPGSIITVRYEDLVLDPEATVGRMYEFFDRPVPLGLNDWVKRTMQASMDNGIYGVERRNGLRHLSKWRSEVNTDDIAIMNQQCLDVLSEYDYELYDLLDRIS